MIAAPIAQGKAEEATDSSLVEAVRQGDDSAFEELYRRHQPEITRFVHARVRDHGRAEDLTQDAFLSALRRLRQTDSDIAFRPWIFEIARNATIDCYRRSSRTEEVSIDADCMPPADAVRLPSNAQPELSIVEHERFESLREAMHELSDVHRRAIVLRELEGRSYREIGARLDLSQAAVESTLFRARRRLAHEYDELDSGNRCRLVGAAIARLAEGLESDRDRRRLDRHARRCSACRRRARTLGVEPMFRARSIAARAAALLPLPAFLRRRLADGAGAAGDAGHGAGVALAPAADAASGPCGKAVALLVTAVFVGGSGATLGGSGPLAPPAPAPPVSEQQVERDSAPDPDAAPAGPLVGDGSPIDSVRRAARREASAAEKAIPTKPTRRLQSSLHGDRDRDGDGDGDGRAVGPRSEAIAPESTVEPSRPAVPAPTQAPSPSPPTVPDLGATVKSATPSPPLGDTLPSVPEAVASPAPAPVGAVLKGAAAQGQVL